LLKNLITKQDVTPPGLRATHGDRTGKQVVNVVLNQTEAITKRLKKEERNLEILQQQYETAKAKYLEQNPDDQELKNWADHPKWYKKVAKAEIAVRVLREDRDELTKSIIELPQKRRISLAEMQVKPDSEEGKKLLKEAHTKLSKFLDKSLAPPKDVILTETNVPSSYSPLLDIMFINFSQAQATSTIIAHEYIHHLEHHNQELRNLSQAFFKSRTKGEKPSSISPSRPDIQIKRDKFIEPYMGRIYDNGSTEVLTVGAEWLLKSPFEFMKKDPEHFAFVYDALRGNFAHLRKEYKEFV